MISSQTLRIWGIPIVLGLLSIAGLIAALVGDGFADVLSWIALGIPLLVGIWFSLRPEKK